MKKYKNSVCGIFGLLLVFFIGCSFDEVTKIKNNLPPEAKEIKSLGNGWYTFEMENRKFLYRYGAGGLASTETITELKND